MSDWVIGLLVLVVSIGLVVRHWLGGAFDDTSE
jgi:hypothetical protein